MIIVFILIELFFTHFPFSTQQMSATELWQWVHSCYGDELGLTSDDDDYVAPSTEDDTKAGNTSSNPHNERTSEFPPAAYLADSTEVCNQLL